MTFELFAFYVFAALALMGAIAVISVKNPVHAVLFLVGTFFTAACLWLLARAEFLAIALILVYVGAVMVLFLFVVMMLDVDVSETREGFVKYAPVSAIVGILMLIQVLLVMGVNKTTVLAGGVENNMGADTNLTLIGRNLFTEQLFAFELAAVILTVAIIAAITLTLRKSNNPKKQNPGEQVLVRREDRIRLVKMDAVKPATSDESSSSGNQGGSDA